MDEAAGKQSQGIQSIEVGLALIRVLAEARSALSLTEVSRRAAMAPAKAHRYLVSFTRAGLVERVPATGQYDLGPLALSLGLAAIGRLDTQRLALDALARLRLAVDETVALAVWGDSGAVIVRWEESSRPVTVNVRVGSTLSPVTSATGRLFAAFLDGARTEAAIEAEFSRGAVPTSNGRTLDRAGYQGLLEDIRRTGISRVVGDYLAGVDALSVPVFDLEGRIVYALTALGPHGSFDVKPGGALERVLRRAAGELSARLGYVASSRAGMQLK